jgi:hypothetical protein
MRRPWPPRNKRRVQENLVASPIGLRNTNLSGVGEGHDKTQQKPGDRGGQAQNRNCRLSERGHEIGVDHNDAVQHGRPECWRPREGKDRAGGRNLGAMGSIVIS